ncbi:serine protease SP24D-like [Cimex lectularius]|uniref:Peptidase S1 domain-containing protein n=1 Tax=Cimex lectularius TaxID=79782 RepID=A0A8I6RG53_CIMLE|nr:serine protease SP24D-like [Cimex lectularius]
MRLVANTIFCLAFLFDNVVSQDDAGKDLGDGDLKIIGGQYASKGEFPYTVALKSHARCGGTLVKLDAIITAASCFYNGDQKVEASTVTVIAGALSIADPKETGYQESKLARFKTHEKYTGKGSGHDIAIGALEKAFVQSANVKTAVYASSKPEGLKDALYTIIEEDTSCVGLGWGNTGAFVSDEVSGGAESLKMVEMRVLPQRECRTAPGMEANEVCIATRRSADKGITDGDAGTTFACQGKFFGLNKGPSKYKIDQKEYEGAIVTVIWPYVNYFGLELNVATSYLHEHTFNLVLFSFIFVTTINRVIH